MESRGRENIEVVAMAGEQYDGGENNDGFLKGFISPNSQIILP